MAHLSASSLRLLNFGCGTTFHSAWVNLDGLPASPSVIAHDLETHFPFDEGSFDAVYGSHVLEHFDSSGAERLLRDCRRILKPGGIIRIVVPDLETIARLYLQCLEGALAGRREDESRYEWMLLELYDQVARNNPGGQMKRFLAGRLEGDMARFVAARVGDEGRALPPEEQPLAWRVMRRLSLQASSLRETIVRGFAFLVLGKRGSAAVREGLFRRSGEIHHWMYDRHSLAKLLQETGFADARRCGAGESAIPGFADFRLEVAEGRERKPDSLYMEARRPAGT
ncbi:MAG TPA: methyltransferase domain-containing protein [Burkholderiales bacterium]|nr:methyltransferase domain-containing protein [Burkholderiales bacterium]